jgi:hypothetical protein
MDIGKYALKKEWTVRLSDMPDGPDSEATFTLRLLSPREQQLAVEAGFENNLVANEDGEMVGQSRVRVRATPEYIFKKSLISWTGIYNDSKDQIPCTDINKRLFLDVAPDIVDWLVGLHGEQARKAQASEPEERGNSSSTSED